jgi:hypothetical protein
VNFHVHDRPDEPTPSRSTNRILWNRRPANPLDCGDIDEIVIHNCIVHVEQMDDRAWWIGIVLPDGNQWMGEFRANSRGVMTFGQTDDGLITWDRDDTH